MLGEAPPAFDLLYWNGDGTNLPAKMAVEYLRGLCQGDGFAKGEFQVFGQPVSLADIKLPLCAIACETDHIAALEAAASTGSSRWGRRTRPSSCRKSGHIAGIINPPSKDKYGHYTNDGPVAGDARGLAEGGATFHKGSWWPRWGAWLAERSGPMITARVPGDSRVLPCARNLCRGPAGQTPDISPAFRGLPVAPQVLLQCRKTT